MYKISSIKFNKDPIFGDKTISFLKNDNVVANSIIIVGENGSGKSRLEKILYWIIYHIFNNRNILNPDMIKIVSRNLLWDFDCDIKILIWLNKEDQAYIDWVKTNPAINDVAKNIIKNFEDIKIGDKKARDIFLTDNPKKLEITINAKTDSFQLTTTIKKVEILKSKETINIGDYNKVDIFLPILQINSLYIDLNSNYFDVRNAYYNQFSSNNNVSLLSYFSYINGFYRHLNINYIDHQNATLNFIEQINEQNDLKKLFLKSYNKFLDDFNKRLTLVGCEISIKIKDWKLSFYKNNNEINSFYLLSTGEQNLIKFFGLILLFQQLNFFVSMIDKKEYKKIKDLYIVEYEQLVIDLWYITNNTIIFIDEIGTSFHPRWQVNILNVVKDILKINSKSLPQIFIITHSELIPFSIDKNHDILINLNHDENNIISFNNYYSIQDFINKSLKIDYSFLIDEATVWLEGKSDKDVLNFVLSNLKENIPLNFRFSNNYSKKVKDINKIMNGSEGIKTQFFSWLSRNNKDLKMSKMAHIFIFDADKKETFNDIKNILRQNKNDFFSYIKIDVEDNIQELNNDIFDYFKITRTIQNGDLINANNKEISYILIYKDSDKEDIFDFIQDNNLQKQLKDKKMGNVKVTLNKLDNNQKEEIIKTYKEYLRTLKLFLK